MKRLPNVPSPTPAATRRPLLGVPHAILLLLLLLVLQNLGSNLNRSLKSIPSFLDDTFDGPVGTSSRRAQQRIDNIPVFYNLFAANDSEHDRVVHLATNQLSGLQTYHQPVYVHSIGYPLSIPNTTLLKHHINASEIVTLQSFWEYCQTHPTEKVIYLHSKGSYHPSEENDQMRGLLTKGALSNECARISHETCNVCSYRFAPFPHPHTPGNMFLAHCSYVNKLIEPKVFTNDMDAVEARLVTKQETHGACVGKGRWAAEHWVHSHPSVKPCDLYNNAAFAWGYDGLAEYQEGDFDLAIAPRYHLDDWPRGCEFSDLTHRLKEYRLLYNMTPGEDWWGWDFWLGPSDKPLWPIRPKYRKRRNTPMKTRAVDAKNRPKKQSVDW